MKNLLSVEVSCFRNYRDTEPVNISLDIWLRSAKYKDKVQQIRNTQDKKVRDALKSDLPAITPSGVFKQRRNDSLVQHSGFLAFDIDEKDNTDIDLIQLKTDLMNLRSIAYCGLSVSGRGIWGLVRLSDPSNHTGHFYALQTTFKSLEIVIDESCKDVSRLRGYSYDPDAKFNYDAVPFTKVLDKPKKPTHRVEDWTKNNLRNVQRCIDNLNGMDVTAQEGDWFIIANALANEFGEQGRSLFHAVSRFHPDYTKGETDWKYDNALKNEYSYTIGSFFEICSRYGIRFNDMYACKH